MKVWTCYNGLFQQTWTYSNANTLSLTNSETNTPFLEQR